MNLLIAEKPSVAVQNYRQLLEKMENETFERRDGYLQGKSWCITWCIGHLVELAMPEEYGWKEWSLEHLPMIPEKWKFNIKGDTKKQFEIIKKLIQESELIVNGTDAGREGELIYRLVAALGGAKGKEQKRLWVNSFVLQDMAKAWKDLKPAEQYNNLFDSALSRSVSDWLIGMNFSRGYAIKTSARNISVGRVQTPTLALIVARDYEVENWREKLFYQLTGRWKGIELTYTEEHGKDFDSPTLLQRIKENCEGKTGVLLTKKVEDKKQNPPKPFDLTGLQKMANKKLDLKAADTLKEAQKLYESKYISYPRTDSEYLPENMKSEAFDILRKVSDSSHQEIIKNENDNFAFFNNSKVTEHYALIPTGEPLGSEIKGKTREVYELIRERFVTAFGKPYLYKNTYLEVNCSDHLFTANLKVEISKGYKLLQGGNDQEEKDDMQLVSDIPLTEGEQHIMESLEVLTRKRTKPKYFTEDTLLTAMETAGRQVEDESLREAMKERGLGTPVTKGEIIETLKRREYVAMSKKHIISTAKGRQLIEVVDQKVSSPEMTGDWEYKLRLMEKGQYEKSVFLSEINSYIKQISTTFGEKDDRIINAIESSMPKCPRCKNGIKVNQWGAFCDHCDLKIFRKIFNKKISDKALLKILETGKSPLIKGFSSKSGKLFDAYLVIDGEGKVSPEFAKKK